MQKKMKSIKLCFENIELVEISAENICAFMFENMQTELHNDWWSDIVKEYEVAQSATILIKPSGNTVIPETNETLFERVLKYNDLVSVDIHYTDNTIREIFLKWSDKDGFSNRFQTSLKTKNGYLIIVADKEKRAKDLQHEVEQYG